MYSKTLWKTLNARSVVNWQHRDAQDAKMLGTVLETASYDSGNNTNHCVNYSNVIW